MTMHGSKLLIELLNSPRCSCASVPSTITPVRYRRFKLRVVDSGSVEDEETPGKLFNTPPPPSPPRLPSEETRFENSERIICNFLLLLVATKRCYISSYRYLSYYQALSNRARGGGSLSGNTNTTIQQYGVVIFYHKSYCNLDSQLLVLITA